MMTLEEAKDLLPIIEAWARGEEIQCLDANGDWADVKEYINTCLSSYWYRIKPKWEPKEGEWCWFWSESNCSAVLSKFSHALHGRYKAESGSLWDCCAPFTGDLPPNLKDDQ